MRRNFILPVMCLVAGVVLGVVAQRILRTPSRDAPPAIDPDLLAEGGDPSFRGVKIRYTSTNGGRYNIQYSAPPRSNRRQASPLVTLTTANQVEIDDGIHHVIINTDEGTILLNHIKYVSRLPERESSLIRAGGHDINIFGDGRIQVGMFQYVAESSIGSDRSE